MDSSCKETGFCLKNLNLRILAYPLFIYKSPYIKIVLIAVRSHQFICHLLWLTLLHPLRVNQYRKYSD